MKKIGFEKEKMPGDLLYRYPKGARWFVFVEPICESGICREFITEEEAKEFKNKLERN